MEELQAFEADEQEDLVTATNALARFWKSRGLGDQVRAIGRENALEGARRLLGSYFALRARRQNAEHAEARDDVPF